MDRARSDHLTPKPWALWRVVWRARRRAHTRVLAVALIFISVNCVPYVLIDAWCSYRGYSAFNPMIGLDQWIPFVPWSVGAYMTYPLYIPLVALIASRDDGGTRAVIMYYQSHVVITLIVYVIFLLCPVYNHLIDAQVPREVLSGEGMWGEVYQRLIYQPSSSQLIKQHGYNSWPSLHIVHTLLATLAASRFLITRRALKVGLWCAWVALSASVLTTKQHFALDWVAGVALTWLMWVRYTRPALAWAREARGDDLNPTG